MTQEPSNRRGTDLLLLLTLFALMTAGLVAALSSLVRLPTGLLALAAVVAIVGLSVFFLAGLRRARQSGQGVLRSFAGTLWDTLRLAFDLL